jgi:MarR-like DNA-binding transcriptional regulator SgrR of sgrS sRNA
MPKPTDDGKTYTFKIRQGVKWHDGSKLTAQDVATSWNMIVFPPKGVTSARVSFYEMVDKIEVPDDATVVFRLKRATTAFLPALADPYAWIYKKEILEKDPHWYEKNIMGSGPFKFVSYDVGQSIKGARNPDYYHEGQPYLDAIVGIFADKQSVRVDALRADRAAIEFRGLPPSARDQLVKEGGADIAVQDSDWNCGNILTPNHRKKPFDDVRVRRALALAIDQWKGAPALAKIATVRTVGSQASPEGGRRRGAEIRAAEPQRRSALQVRRHLGDRRVEEDRRQRRAEGRAHRPVVPEYARGHVRRRARSQLRERGQSGARHRQVPAGHGLSGKLRRLRRCQVDRAVRQDADRNRSYVKGWKISPSQYLNQDLGNIWLDK